MDKLIKKSANIAVLIIAFASSLAALIYNINDSETTLNWCFYIVYFMVITVFVLLLLFSGIEIFSEKKRIVKTSILFVLCAVIVLLAYFIAPSDISEVGLRLNVSQSVYKWVGAGINVAYISFFGVVATLIGFMIFVKIKN